MIITIDGPIATGKSTIAKKLAEEMGYIYFDTGAMYRCIAYLGLKEGANIDDAVQLQQLLDHFQFDIKVRHGERRYFVNKEDVTEQIRGEAVTAFVAKVSALKTVRQKMVAMQQSFATGVNAVFEGRDMGTVVFPHADLKIFLIGRPEVRAKRRFDELKIKFPEETQNLTLEKALEDINARDLYDTTREISPLKKAEDAHEVDTSDSTIDDVILTILELKDTLKKTRLTP
jgi:cytidylate kinase